MSDEQTTTTVVELADLSNRQQPPASSPSSPEKDAESDSISEKDASDSLISYCDETLHCLTGCGCCGCCGCCCHRRCVFFQKYRFCNLKCRRCCLNFERCSYFVLGLITATNGLGSSNWGMFGLTILFSRVFSGLVTLDFLVKLICHIVATFRQVRQVTTNSATNSATTNINLATTTKTFLRQFNGTTADPRASGMLFVLYLCVPFLMSAHIMSAANYLSTKLPTDTMNIWGTDYLRPTYAQNANPVGAQVQLFDWLFGDLAPCSLIFGAMTQFPDTTVTWKNLKNNNFASPPKVSFSRYPFDHQYVPYEPALKLDIYYPPAASATSADGSFPVFLYYHGGGWRYGDRKRDVPLCTVNYLLARGIAFVSVDYRLLQHGFNGSHLLEDTFDVVAWLHRNETRLKYNLDMTKSVACGNSAGGHLAMMAGYWLSKKSSVVESTKSVTTRRGGGGGVSGVITLWGVEPGYANRTSQAFTGNQKWMEDFYSPANHIDATSPPTLLIHGQHDTAVNIGQSEYVANRLKKYGVKHQLVAIPAQNHACDIEPFGPCYAAQAYTLQYFLKYVYDL